LTIDWQANINEAWFFAGNDPEARQDISPVMILKKEWPVVFQLLSVGFFVAFALLVPALVGFYFDRSWAHHFPYLTLSGLGLGTILMIVGVYRMVKPYLNENEKPENQDLEKPNSGDSNG
jgi:hypothetical protein